MSNQDIYNHAAAELPHGWQIVITLENGYGGVQLVSPDSEEIDFDDPEDSIETKIRQAIDRAVSEETPSRPQ